MTSEPTAEHLWLGTAAGIRDVASAAGVSVTTVSNVLNGRDRRMRPETKERVLQAIDRLGYRPSALARQFRTGRTRTLGLVVPSVANPFWGAVAHQVERAALAKGYSLLICNSERDIDAERNYAEMLLASGVRGVILGSSPLSFAPFAELAARGLLIAAFDDAPPNVDSVVALSASVDNELGARMAAQHLVGLGHRRIGFVSGPMDTASRLRRLQGVRTTLAKVGLDLDPALLWEGAGIRGFGDTEGPELGRVAIRELLSRDDPPTAVITVNDMYALGCIAGARDLGFSVPEDLSVVGFDDVVLAQIVQPALTTIRQPLAPMAEYIVEGLAARLNGISASAVHQEAMPELIVRASTAAPRGPALP